MGKSALVIPCASIPRKRIYVLNDCRAVLPKHTCELRPERGALRAEWVLALLW